MPVPITNPSLLDMQDEYGDPNGATATIPLNLFYAGRTVVSNPPPSSAYGSIPVWAGTEAASGSISIGVFRGTSAAPSIQVISVVIAASVANVSMRQLAIDNGWTNTSIPLDLTVTINPGVTVYSATPTASAMAPKKNADPSFPPGSIIKLINNGTIAGAGGAAGAGGNVVGTSVAAAGNGGSGGTGFNANVPVIIYNYGTIGGGGGGGGGGGSIYAINASKKASTVGAGGGGGGGGRAGGTGGAGGGATGNTTNDAGTGGNTATLSAAGVAGAGGLITGKVQGGTGGAGGNLGQDGSNGSPATLLDANLTATLGAAGTGGPAGPAIINGANITWGAFGTILGTGFTPNFTISRSVTNVNEGGSVTFTLTGSVPSGAAIPYTITGISSSDIGGASLTGNFTSAAPSRTLTLASDGLTEGAETITIRLNNPTTPPTVMPSQTCTVNDTSTGGGSVAPSGGGTWDSYVYSFDTVAPIVYPIARIQFFPDGTSSVNTGTGSGTPVAGANWFTVTTPGIGSSYWVRATATTDLGTGNLGGTFGSWISLSSTAQWTATRVTPGTYSVIVTFEFSTSASGSPIVATHTGCFLTSEFNT